MPSDNQIDLTVVVNGQPQAVRANVHAPLRTVVEHALHASGNSGQPIANWQLRNAAGEVLDPSAKVEDFHFSVGTTLFLNLMAGIGG